MPIYRKLEVNIFDDEFGNKIYDWKKVEVSKEEQPKLRVYTMADGSEIVEPKHFECKEKQFGSKKIKYRVDPQIIHLENGCQYKPPPSKTSGRVIVPAGCTSPWEFRYECDEEKVQEIKQIEEEKKAARKAKREAKRIAKLNKSKPEQKIEEENYDDLFAEFSQPEIIRAEEQKHTPENIQDPTPEEIDNLFNPGNEEINREEEQFILESENMQEEPEIICEEEQNPAPENNQEFTQEEQKYMFDAQSSY